MRKSFLSTILLILSVSLLSWNAKSTKEINEVNHDDTICVKQQQLLLDNIFTCGKMHYANSALYNSGLKGHVMSISIPKAENSLYFSFDYIEFNKDGAICTIKSDDEYLNIQEIDIDDINACVNMIFDEDICLSSLTFDFKSRDKKIFNYNAEGFDLTYTFYYSPNGEPIKIIKVEKEAHYEVEKMRQTEETEIFDVRIDQKDNNGNWVSLSLNSPKSSHTIKRYIQYYDDVKEKPQLIETGSKNKIFFSITNEYDNEFLRFYDKNTKIIHKIIPPGYEGNEEFGYKDFKLIGNRLYTILITGASGALAYNMDCAVYFYNIETEEWNEIGYCGDDCKIVNNKILMPFYDPEHNRNYEELYEMK